MKKNTIMRLVAGSALYSLLILNFSGCTENSTTSPAATGGEFITFKTAIDNSLAPPSGGTTSHGSATSPGSQIDSIEITDGGLFVSNMLFFSNPTGDETDLTRTEVILRDDHFILDFEGYGKQYIGARSIDAASFRSIRFTLAPGNGNSDSLSNALGASYNNFFRSAAGSTIVIRGNLWVGNQKFPYEYRSAITGNELAVFSSAFTITPGGQPEEVDVVLKTSAAFMGTGGTFLDPRDGRNASAIDANLRTSLTAIAAGSGS